VDSRHHQELADLDQHYWWFKVRHRFVARWLEQDGPLHRRRLILDWGCGGGGFLSYLRAEYGVPNDRLLGYEPAAEADRVLERRRIRRLDWVQGRNLSESLPVRPDVITALDVLEHVPNPCSLLMDLADVAAPAARLVVLVPAFQHLWSGWDERLGHVRRYDRPLLRRTLSEAGWRVIDSRFLFSAAYPAAIARRYLIARSVCSDVEFPKVSPAVNRMLRATFDLECRLPDLGVGTTLAMRACRNGDSVIR
jgi:SAM-dependent methyltransferase